MRLVTVASRTTSPEAHVIRAKLELEGIRAFVADELLILSRWDYSNAVGGVKVQVAEEDYTRALEILNAAAQEWICAACGEAISSDFEACWSCGAPPQGPPATERAVEDPATAEGSAGSRPAIGATSAEATISSPPVERSETDAANPYRSPLTPHDAQQKPPTSAEAIDTSEGDEMAYRAWRAAALGVFFCPPLFHFYSGYLLLALAFSDRPLSRKGTIRCRVAWAINFLMAAVFGLSGLASWW